MPVASLPTSIRIPNEGENVGANGPRVHCVVRGKAGEWNVGKSDGGTGQGPWRNIPQDWRLMDSKLIELEGLHMLLMHQFLGQRRTVGTLTAAPHLRDSQGFACRGLR